MNESSHYDNNNKDDTPIKGSQAQGKHTGVPCFREPND